MKQYLIPLSLLTLSVLILIYQYPNQSCQQFQGNWEGLQVYQTIPKNNKSEFQMCIYRTYDYYISDDIYFAQKNISNLIASLGHGLKVDCPKINPLIYGNCLVQKHFGFMEFNVDPELKYSTYGQGNTGNILSSSFYDQIESQTSLIQKPSERFSDSLFNLSFENTLQNIDNYGFDGICENLSGQWQISALTTGENGSGSVYYSNCLQNGSAIVQSTQKNLLIQFNMDEGHTAGKDEGIFCDNVSFNFSIDCNSKEQTLIMQNDYDNLQLSGIFSDDMIILQGQSQFLVLVRDVISQ